MKIDEVKALAEILSQSDLSSLEYKEGDLSIRIERTVACRRQRRPNGCFSDHPSR